MEHCTLVSITKLQKKKKLNFNRCIMTNLKSFKLKFADMWPFFDFINLSNIWQVMPDTIDH